MFGKISLFTNKSVIYNNKSRLNYVENLLSNYATAPNNKVDFKNTLIVKFYQRLVELYNLRNFKVNENNREDIGLISKILEKVKKPTEKGILILEHKDFSLENINTIYEQNKKNKNVENFVYKYLTRILQKYSGSSKDVLIDLVKSKNFKDYIKNYKNYQAYLFLNKYDNEAVKKLDAMIESKTYNKEKYENLKKISQISFLKNFSADSKLHSENIIDIFNENGNRIFQILDDCDNFNYSKISEETEKILLEMYLTSNEKNADIRSGILKHADKKYSRLEMTSDRQEEILKETLKLFNTIDNDKNAFSFVKKTLKTYGIQDVEMINIILEKVPTLKLNIFKRNVINIIRQVRKNEILETLDKNITKTFFETPSVRFNRLESEKYGYRKPRSVFRKMYDSIANNMNIMYYHIQEAFNTSATKSEAVKTREKILNTTENPFVADTIKDNVSENFFSTTNLQINDVANSEIINQSKTKAEIRKEKKAEVVKNVFDITKNKLGVKTYAKQQNDFGLYANKIRLQFLPEIFASIAETRKIDKAVGKLKSNSSNTDALQLYMLINGNNKKLVNYLLKKRNIDGSRMFEVKDIINILKKAENKIAEKKKSNPEYKARDSRAYYNHLYEAKIQEYGKVKRTKSK